MFRLFKVTLDRYVTLICIMAQLAAELAARLAEERVSAQNPLI